MSFEKWIDNTGQYSEMLGVMLKDSAEAGILEDILCEVVRKVELRAKLGEYINERSILLKLVVTHHYDIHSRYYQQYLDEKFNPV